MKVVEKKFTLFKPPMKPGQCPECATVHDPQQPHHQQSLYWQYYFREKHDSWPTWKDAMAHCTPKMQAAWTEELAKRGIAL